jgi:hypothetical protein
VIFRVVMYFPFLWWLRLLPSATLFWQFTAVRPAAAMCWRMKSQTDTPTIKARPT